MKKSILLLVIILTTVFLSQSYCQEPKTISQARKDNLIKLLNYRFKGGFYTFEKMFVRDVTYPEMAIANCIVGIALVSLRVNCEGEVYDLKIKTPLGYGIDNEISSFFASTAGHWNTCNDDKYTRFEVPIQFILKGTITNNEDALLVLEADNPGFLCNGDEYYLKKMEKYMSKGKYKKALPYIDILIRRDPYNSVYMDLKKKAINGGD